MERILRDLLGVSPKNLVEVQGNGMRKLSRFCEDLRRHANAADSRSNPNELSNIVSC